MMHVDMPTATRVPKQVLAHAEPDYVRGTNAWERNGNKSETKTSDEWICFSILTQKFISPFSIRSPFSP